MHWWDRRWHLKYAQHRQSGRFRGARVSRRPWYQKKRWLLVLGMGVWLTWAPWTGTLVGALLTMPGAMIKYVVRAGLTQSGLTPSAAQRLVDAPGKLMDEVQQTVADGQKVADELAKRPKPQAVKVPPIVSLHQRLHEDIGGLPLEPAAQPVRQTTTSVIGVPRITYITYPERVQNYFPASKKAVAQTLQRLPEGHRPVLVLVERQDGEKRGLLVLRGPDGKPRKYFGVDGERLRILNPAEIEGFVTPRR